MNTKFVSKHWKWPFKRLKFSKNLWGACPQTSLESLCLWRSLCFPLFEYPGPARNITCQAILQPWHLCIHLLKYIFSPHVRFIKLNMPIHIASLGQLWFYWSDSVLMIQFDPDFAPAKLIACIFFDGWPQPCSSRIRPEQFIFLFFKNWNKKIEKKPIWNLKI